MMIKKCIVITQEKISLEEIDSIKSLLDAGCERIHIRKPNSIDSELRPYLDLLCSKVDSSKLTMHYYHNLAKEYGFGGVHGFSEKAEMFDFKSVSSHSIEEMENLNNIDYSFISPVFDSISKVGYKSAFSLENLKNFIDKKPLFDVVALGGIDVSKLDLLKENHFNTIALLGGVWKDGCENATNNFLKIYNKWK
ncbi:MAG: thiamine phosphate synthase [Bacteroidetes bacterium]|nr:thiamine phosphate synthase [Bacteroidota bacterium]